MKFLISFICLFLSIFIGKLEASKDDILKTYNQFHSKEDKLDASKDSFKEETSNYKQDPLPNQFTILQHFNFSNLHVLILNDGSVWQILPLKQRKQTFSEWWKSQIPKLNPLFFWKYNDWLPTNRIFFVNEKSCIKYIDEIKESLSENDIQKLRSYKHAVENTDSIKEKIAFAKRIDLTELLNSLKKFAEERYKTGIKEGNDLGYLKGTKTGEKTGYKKGYDTGYLKGTKTGEKTGYKTGYNAGYSKITEKKDVKK